MDDELERLFRSIEGFGMVVSERCKEILKNKINNGGITYDLSNPFFLFKNALDLIESEIEESGLMEDDLVTMEPPNKIKH